VHLLLVLLHKLVNQISKIMTRIDLFSYFIKKIIIGTQLLIKIEIN
jgi:hypothetical protein